MAGGGKSRPGNGPLHRLMDPGCPHPGEYSVAFLPALCVGREEGDGFAVQDSRLTQLSDHFGEGSRALSFFSFHWFAHTFFCPGVVFITGKIPRIAAIHVATRRGSGAASCTRIGVARFVRLDTGWIKCNCSTDHSQAEGEREGQPF